MTMAKRILIVDDEKDVLLYLKTLFEKNGYETATARNGEEGYARAKDFKPDLITLDIRMPKQSGTSLYCELRKELELQGIPVIVLTGYSRTQESYADEMPADCVPDAFVEKPIIPEQLLKIVERLTS
jgi:CheY-like chemotaxis protein